MCSTISFLFNSHNSNEQMERKYWPDNIDVTWVDVIENKLFIDFFFLILLLILMRAATNKILSSFSLQKFLQFFNNGNISNMKAERTMLYLHPATQYSQPPTRLHYIYNNSFAILYVHRTYTQPCCHKLLLLPAIIIHFIIELNNQRE